MKPKISLNDIFIFHFSSMSTQPIELIRQAMSQPSVNQFSACQLIGLHVTQSVSQSISQLVSQPASQPVNQSVS